MRRNIVFVCKSCGYESPRWLGRCPLCGEWDTFEKKSISDEAKKKSRKRTDISPYKLSDIKSFQKDRYLTEDEDLNRVLGGGFIMGQVALLGGEPGIGKSTLLLQVSHSLIQRGIRVLYASGEESPEQIKMRAERLGFKSSNLELLSTVYVDELLSVVERERYDFVVVDSIQTFYYQEMSSPPGSPSQLREATKSFIEYAKKKGAVFILVGHITKSGEIAGPKILEHLVDSVFYFEGDRFSYNRILRSIKNRFGPSGEIAIYEITEKGLVSADERSLIGDLKKRENVTGVSIFPLLEGTRPICVEIQSLTSKTPFIGNPRRVFQGIERQRGSMLIAVLEKKLKIEFFDEDVFIKISGGLSVRDPSADLSIIASILSSKYDVPVIDSVFIGEVSLTGEVRPSVFPEKRVQAILKYGVKRIFLSEDSFHKNLKVQVFEIGHISELKSLFNKKVK